MIARYERADSLAESRFSGRLSHEGGRELSSLWEGASSPPFSHSHPHDFCSALLLSGSPL